MANLNKRRVLLFMYNIFNTSVGSWGEPYNGEYFFKKYHRMELSLLACLKVCVPWEPSPVPVSLFFKFHSAFRCGINSSNHCVHRHCTHVHCVSWIWDSRQGQNLQIDAAALSPPPSWCQQGPFFSWGSSIVYFMMQYTANKAWSSKLHFNFRNLV